MTTKFVLVALASAITLGAVSHSYAGEVLPSGYEQRSMVVRLDDLNLDSGAGAERMKARVSYAARYVCGVDGGVTDIERRVQRRACVDSTIQHSLAQVDAIHPPSLRVANAATR